MFSCYEWLSLDAVHTQFFILEIYIPFCLLFLCVLQSEMEVKSASSQILSCEPSSLRIIKICQGGFIHPENFLLNELGNTGNIGGKINLNALCLIFQT